MLVANQKPICLIGYKVGTLVLEAKHFFSQEFHGEIVIIDPDEFFQLKDHAQYQYGVAFNLDTTLRAKVIDYLDTNQLDCVTYIHDTVICYTKDISTVVGKGSFVGPFSTILQHSKIGQFCIVESYCLISHYAKLGNNVHLHSGAMIAGRTNVGNNSTFNFKSAAINSLELCDNIEVGACSTITKNIDQPGLYVGTPARRVGDVKDKNVS